MPRYKIEIEYIGTNFYGWQRQASGISIQALIENAIFQFSQETVQVYGSGRTDSGVHALGQVAHFDLDATFMSHNVINGINYYLKPNLIAIQKCEIVSTDFHARFSAKKRHYMYRIINRKGKLIIDQDRAWSIKPPLDLNAMIAASKHLIGNHDFSSFRAARCQAKSPIKTLEQISFEQNGQEINIYFSAPSFLHHMVRNITGTLVNVGLGKIAVIDVKNILEAKDRVIACATAPACGLYFTHVEY